MSRAWLIPGLLFWVGCWDRPVPYGFPDGQPEPMLLFRCEEGRIAAYMTLDPPEQSEDGSIPEGAVPVELDSVVPCEPAAV